MQQLKVWHLFVAVLAIAGTQVACAWWTNNTIRREAPESSSWELGQMGKTLDSIEKNTQTIDERLMSPEERWQKFQSEAKAQEWSRRFEEERRKKAEEAQQSNRRQ